jgi:Protein of unknown function (DUF3147)
VDLVTILLKGIAGGVLVVLFALLGEVIRPRNLAGITSGAPSVAAAGLVVTLLSSGAMMAWNLSLGMIAGAVGLVAWCLVGADAVKRFGGLKGSVATTAVWFVVALSLWAVVWR